MCNNFVKILLLFSLLFSFSCSEKGETENSITPQEKPSVPDNGNGGNEEDDSESVTPLPDNIELGEETVQLNKAQLDNIVSVDENNTTLTFSSSIPDAYIPEVDQIILQLEPTELLPFGFLGRVTNVVNNGTTVVVETEAPSLAEAFDKLEFDEELKMLQSPTRASWGTDEYGYHYFTFDANANVEIVKGVSVGVEGDITFACKTIAQGAFNKDIDQKNLNVDFKTKIRTSDLAFKISGKRDNSDGKFLKVPIGKAIPFTGLLGKLTVEAALQIYAGGQLSGEAGLRVGFSHESAKSFQMKSESGKWLNLQPSSDDGSELSAPAGEGTFSPDVSFYLDGSAMLGFFTGFELRLFGRDDYKLSIAPYAGYEVSSNQNLINLADIKYKESKDVHVTGAVVAGIDASAKANFFNREVEASFFNLQWRGAEMHRYIFPSFDGSCVINGDTNRAECEVTVERDVLIPMEVGVEQYDEETLVERYKPLPYHLNKTFPNPYTANFSHQIGYSYWTYVKWLDNYVKCSELKPKEDDNELRALLEKFYHDTGGDNWVRKDNWCTDAPLNEWYGVILYEDGDEVKLRLSLYYNNLIGSGTLSGCKSLVELDCYNNQLTSLDLSGCTSLVRVDCEDNQLTNLDVSGCISLERLYCDNNQLTNLDISGCTSLKYLSCVDNQLTSLDASGCTSLVEWSCSSLQLTSLDVSGCTSLENLDCYDNQLTSLNVSGCTSLERLDCDNNQLTSLDLSGCTSLVRVYCENNHLASLDVSGCTSLVELYCYDNQLTSLDVSGCTSLERLDCTNNQLTNLDVFSCTSLWELNCANNQLTNLDVFSCTSLWELYCSYNQLTSLDVSGCTSLVYLHCENNQLTSLNVSGCTSLKELYCSNNQLTSLDATSCTSLKYLGCQNNKITQVITDFYHKIGQISYDQRYTDYHYESIYDSKGNKIGEELRYTDNGVGWWFPGEPQKGYHGE